MVANCPKPAYIKSPLNISTNAKMYEQIGNRQNMTTTFSEWRKKSKMQELPEIKLLSPSKRMMKTFMENTTMNSRRKT